MSLLERSKVFLPDYEPSKSQAPIDMSRVAAIILGGGQGTRLFPLTMTRCKPAISFGGKHCLIDIPMSNSINSGCLKIFILTQFLSSSLHQHIFKTYRIGTYSSGFIEVLSAEQKHNNDSGWFQGTADAVRQSMDHFIETPVDYFLILSGDQLYNINFQEMMIHAKQTDADVVVAALPVSESNAKRMGLLKVNEKTEVIDFLEKPQEKKLLDRMKIPNESCLGISLKEGHSYLGSMGIYLFKREALFKLLIEDPRADFGKHLIPRKVEKGNVVTFIHKGYWEDIGTIESFYSANIALTNERPEFNWYDESNPIFTAPSNLPGPKIFDTHIKYSSICDGAIVEAEEIVHSILGPRTVVKKGTHIRNSYLMGNEFYVSPVKELFANELTIGENCHIVNAIIDKNVHIGNNVHLVNKNQLVNYDGQDIYIRDGIIVVPRGARLPDGFAL